MPWETVEDVEADFAQHGEAWLLAEAASGRRNEGSLRHFREWKAGHDVRMHLEQEDRDHRSLAAAEASAKAAVRSAAAAERASNRAGWAIAVSLVAIIVTVATFLYARSL
jgi:hypothetical protein